MSGTLVPINVLPGVEPSTDRPETSTQHYTFTKGIRFEDGFPQKIGGWTALALNQNDEITGAARSIFSYELDNLTRFLIGTNTRLYDLFGGAATNITPLNTATIAIPDSLDTYHDTLANNPIATVSGSSTITITDAAHKFREGDVATLSGSTAVNGIPASEINADQFVRTVSENSYTVIVNTPATSTGTGGGGSVVRASGYVTVNENAHGLENGDRVRINDAADFGGITAAQVNIEFEIRNVQANTYDVYTVGTSTSAVTGGGGNATTYQEPIQAGQADTLVGQGYGVGLYGVGLYGVSGSSLTNTPPRLWSHDRFGNLTVSTPGEQGFVYEWNGSTTSAPTILPNSVPANYVFVSDSIVVILGYDNALGLEAGNGITWSDQGDRTNFTSGQAGSDVIEGAGTFISHASARGENLLFTENQVYTFRYIAGQLIWQTRLLEPAVGLIAQNARVSAVGNVFWMGNDNFYMWRGGAVEVIPANSTGECTALNYVFSDFNFGQKDKVFAWYNTEFREVWWHYPSAGSNEPDRIIRLNIDDFVWTIDEMDRTAAEYPSVREQTPYLIDPDNTVFLHENGEDDNGEGLEWQLDSPFFFTGSTLGILNAFIPDYVTNGSITCTLELKDYPLSTPLSTTTVMLDGTPNSDRIAVDRATRFTQYRLSGNDLNQTLKMGTWYQEITRSTSKA